MLAITRGSHFTLLSGFIERSIGWSKGPGRIKISLHLDFELCTMLANRALRPKGMKDSITNKWKTGGHFFFLNSSVYWESLSYKVAFGQPCFSVSSKIVEKSENMWFNFFETYHHISCLQCILHKFLLICIFSHLFFFLFFVFFVIQNCSVHQNYYEERRVFH